MLCDAVMRILIFPAIDILSSEQGQGMVIRSPYFHSLNIPEVTNKESPPSVGKLFHSFLVFIVSTF